MLLRLPFRFAPYAVYLWDAFEALFGTEARLWTSLFASAAYFASLILVQQLAQRTLFLASMVGAFARTPRPSLLAPHP